MPAIGAITTRRRINVLIDIAASKTETDTSPIVLGFRIFLPLPRRAPRHVVGTRRTPTSKPVVRRATLSIPVRIGRRRGWN